MSRKIGDHNYVRTALQRWLNDQRRTEADLIERCTSTHPDHETCTQPIGGERQFWQAWCSICRAHGWDKTGPANPEMSAARIAAYDQEFALALSAPEVS
jgi:hypothetical protein